MSDKKQLELIPDDFKLQGAEFAHVFRSMMDSGKIADMSGSALKVYIVIKLLSSFKSGQTTVSSEMIGEKSGLSKSQVLRATKELRELKLLFSERVGRRNTYKIIERIPGVHKTGSPEVLTEFFYSKESTNKLVRSIKTQVVDALKENGSGEDLVFINGDLNIQINFINTADKKEPETVVDVEFDPVEEMQSLPWKR